MRQGTPREGGVDRRAAHRGGGRPATDPVGAAGIDVVQRLRDDLGRRTAGHARARRP